MASTPRMSPDAEAAADLVTGLVGGIAHDINNSLACARMNIELVGSKIQAHSATDSPLRACLDLLGEASNSLGHVRTLVRSLEAFTARDEIAAIDPTPVIESAICVAATAVRRRARVVSNLEVLPKIDASAPHLARVLLGLIVDAAQAITAGGPVTQEIHVRAQTDAEGGLLVEVHDIGSDAHAEPNMSEDTCVRLRFPPARANHR